jgi:hypothetical protein
MIRASRSRFPGNQDHQLAHVPKILNLRGLELHAELLFDRDNDVDVVKGVPALRLIRRGIEIDLEFLVIVYVKNVTDYIGDLTKNLRLVHWVAPVDDDGCGDGASATKSRFESLDSASLATWSAATKLAATHHLIL